ncbi:MAG: FHA domain-containing protein [Tissierellia bacterium]|nr:FHA domain-containing protein [Tissierellia bacterium]
MFDILSMSLKYVLIAIVYLFIMNIVRMIYLDIKSIGRLEQGSGAYLKVVNRLDSLGYKMREYYTLGEGLTMGRQKSNNVIIKDSYVSKHHCKIKLGETGYILEDLNSSNGTYLNAERILDPVLLRDGDYIGIGSLEFIFVDKGGDGA